MWPCLTLGSRGKKTRCKYDEFKGVETVQRIVQEIVGMNDVRI